MHELRWNPVMQTWVMLASGREKRPLMPENYCPFCPGSKQVPNDYDVFAYQNDWPILSTTPPETTELPDSFFKNTPAYGRCEVLLYTSDHNSSLAGLSSENMGKLVDLWVDRHTAFAADEKVQYVFIFENRGPEIGATILHPHGQIYGFPFIPKKIEIELEGCKTFYAKEGKNLYREMLAGELRDGSRIVDENDSFVTFVPYFAEYPYQVYIMPREHRLSIDALNDTERRDLGRSVATIVEIYDNVFNRPFPYMMCFHQQPVDGNEYPYYQFHIEFYPPLRNEKTKKFDASSETGAMVHGNPSSPEIKAQEMRTIKEKLHGKK